MNPKDMAVEEAVALAFEYGATRVDILWLGKINGGELEGHVQAHFGGLNQEFIPEMFVLQTKGYQVMALRYFCDEAQTEAFYMYTRNNYGQMPSKKMRKYLQECLAHFDQKVAAGEIAGGVARQSIN